MGTLKVGDDVCFLNDALHEIDNAYPPSGAEGKFMGYSRPDKSRAWIQWDEGLTKGDGFWSCDVADLAVINRAVWE